VFVWRMRQLSSTFCVYLRIPTYLSISLTVTQWSVVQVTQCIYTTTAAKYDKRYTFVKLHSILYPSKSVVQIVETAETNISNLFVRILGVLNVLMTFKISTRKGQMFFFALRINSEWTKTRNKINPKTIKT